MISPACLSSLGIAYFQRGWVGKCTLRISHKFQPPYKNVVQQKVFNNQIINNMNMIQRYKYVYINSFICHQYRRLVHLPRYEWSRLSFSQIHRIAAKAARIKVCRQHTCILLYCCPASDRPLINSFKGNCYRYHIWIIRVGSLNNIYWVILLKNFRCDICI